MLNNLEYIRLSLELHLFFARIMKEHSIFMQAGFVDKDIEYKRVANDFQKSFDEILNRVVDLANNNISQEVLVSQEIVTDNTLSSENKTTMLSGLTINENITRKEMRLNSGMVNDNPQLLNEVGMINNQVLTLLNELIEFKQDILNQVLSCKMYTTNYPLLIAHIMNEAIVYRNILTRIQNREIIDSKYMYEQELFWNNIMKEHAQFIRGLLDPSENDLILTSDRFANEYRQILRSYYISQMDLTSVSLEETINFSALKRYIEEEILNCEVKGVILPLLIDHVLREANHFIRILKQYENISKNNL